MVSIFPSCLKRLKELSKKVPSDSGSDGIFYPLKEICKNYVSFFERKRNYSNVVTQKDWEITVFGNAVTQEVENGDTKDFDC